MSDEQIVFEIIRQPCRRHKFRRESDLEKGSHGNLSNCGEPPSVRLRIITNRNVERKNVKCKYFLIVYFEQVGKHNEYVMSPHGFYPINRKKATNPTVNENGENNFKQFLKYEFTQFTTHDNSEEQIRTSVYELDHTICLSKKVENNGYNEIIKTKLTDYNNELRSSSRLRVEDIENMVKEITAKLNEVTIKTTVVRLKFELHKIDGNNCKYVVKTLTSDPIENCEHLKISVHSIANPKASTTGGDRICVLGIFDKSKYNITIYEKSNPANSKNISDIEIFRKSALLFKAPAFESQIAYINNEINCLLKIYEVNKPDNFGIVEFIYDCARGRKRAIQSESNSFREKKRIFSSANDQFDLIDKETDPNQTELITNADESNEIETETENGCLRVFNEYKKTKDSKLYDAIVFNHFDAISKMSENSQQLQEYIQNFVDENEDNLLHIYCELNRPKHIRRLIRYNCSILLKNRQNATPLHIAIEKEHTACLQQFITAIERPGIYTSFGEQLKRLPEIHNSKGYTVLHLAVLYKQYEFLKTVLDFYKKENVRVCAVSQLYNGDTMAHLALQSENFRMCKLIHTYDNDAFNYENYNGTSCLDLNPKLLNIIDSINVVIELTY